MMGKALKGFWEETEDDTQQVATLILHISLQHN